jgi:probable F420-dependent oxidoreductase
MQFGLHLGIRGPAAEPASLKVLATEAEALGFTHLGFSDHVVIAAEVNSPYPYTKTGRWFAQDTGDCLEQVSTICFVAAATSRIRLLTSVMVLPHRQPILAAKMLTTADVLSGGRLTVGVGVGWMAEEIALLSGPAFAARGKAADEYVAAFRDLWTEPRPKFQGEHVAYDGLLFQPKPVQTPHPPIWVGGETAPARRRAGRMGDGWYPVGNNPAAPYDTLERYAAAVSEVRAAAERAGRDPDLLAQALFAIWVRLGEAEPTADGSRRRFTGSAQAIVDDIGAYRDAGLQHLVVGFESGSLEPCLDRMRAFAAEVMGKLG